MSFKGFIKTNYLRFIYINILSVISGVAAIGAGYIQMYWLTYIKDRAWVKILLATALMGILYLAAQGMIYYIQFVIRVQEEEYGACAKKLGFSGKLKSDNSQFTKLSKLS